MPPYICICTKEFRYFSKIFLQMPQTKWIQILKQLKLAKLI